MAMHFRGGRLDGEIHPELSVQELWADWDPSQQMYTVSDEDGETVGAITSSSPGLPDPSRDRSATEIVSHVLAIIAVAFYVIGVFCHIPVSTDLWGLASLFALAAWWLK